MAGTKRLTDLMDYKSILPYASELFGVYQPLLGWRSARRMRRIATAVRLDAVSRLSEVSRLYAGAVRGQFNPDHQLDQVALGVGQPRAADSNPATDSVLLRVTSDALRAGAQIPSGAQWKDVVSRDTLTELLNGPVYDAYRASYQRRLQEQLAAGANPAELQAWLMQSLTRESAIAGVMADLGDRQLYDALHGLLLVDGADNETLNKQLGSLQPTTDPFLTFDPTKAISEVSVSPLGIVHLFRQFFFELDAFLGSPVGHVWISPGATVELVEVSTRRNIVERTIQASIETTSKSERSTTDQDEISDAVKQNNRDDMKLGFTATVNQSWPSGSATATGSLNLDKTQETSREQAHKRMRNQTEKLSSEIRQNFKSTFRTITETIDTSSKRYVLTNPTNNLINYELRRKMRQVAVQVQDVGAYLCWETFVDDPGRDLSLAHLIHIAKPADLVLVPNPKLTPMPPERLSLGFSGEAVWNHPDNAPQHGEDHPEVRGQFVPMVTLDIPGVPDGYEVVVEPVNPFIDIEKTVEAAKDNNSWGASNWTFRGMITSDGKRVIVGLVTAPKPNGMAWDDRITFKVGGSVACQLSAAKKAEINSANDALITAKLAADQENQRRIEQAYLEAVRDRVNKASNVKPRTFEDLREEERTVVYRKLIATLMTEHLYSDTPDTPTGHQTRHVLSEMINAVFDIDKMLYFVAPEWWKPRKRAGLMLGGAAIPDSIEGSVVRWANDEEHGKYFITDESKQAPLGSSLGWLLELDGDPLRNAFLNAPWVKAVIPIRPRKERAALNWLRSVNVEGSDGLDSAYVASPDELAGIRKRLLAHDGADPVGGHADVTVDDAIRDLSETVADKYAASNVVGRYPESEINDDNRVSATPIERVFEHGFYPLVGGFKAKTEAPFEVFSQWIEVLPTDQVGPVPVEYDPRTGRQK